MNGVPDPMKRLLGCGCGCFIFRFTLASEFFMHRHRRSCTAIFFWFSSTDIPLESIDGMPEPAKGLPTARPNLTESFLRLFCVSTGIGLRWLAHGRLMTRQPERKQSIRFFLLRRRRRCGAAVTFSSTSCDPSRRSAAVRCRRIGLLDFRSAIVLDPVSSRRAPSPFFLVSRLFTHDWRMSFASDPRVRFFSVALLPLWVPLWFWCGHRLVWLASIGFLEMYRVSMGCVGFLVSF